MSKEWVMSWTLSLRARNKVKSKVKPALRLDRGFVMDTLVVDLTGPIYPRTQYITSQTLKSMGRRARRRLLLKHNLVVAVEKMTDLVKKYPKEIGYRRCNGFVGTRLTQADLEDYVRYINLNIKKQELKVKIGRTDETMPVIQARARAIMDYLVDEGYSVSHIHLSPTQGRAIPLIR